MNLPAPSSYKPQSTESSTSPGSSECWFAYSPWIIAAAAALIRAAFALSTGRTAEDALITLRYADNLGTGHGFVYNLGERVLGTTTPLYTLLLAAASWLLGPGTATIAWGKTLNILADGATCILLCAWLRAAGRPGVGLLAAMLYAVDPRAINWNASGMETGLVTLAGMTAIIAHSTKRYCWSAVALAALVLLRFDGLILAAILFGAFLIRERKFPAWPALVFAALLIPWILFASLYFGSPIPTSIRAKFVIYPHFAHTMFPQFDSFVHQMIGSPADLVAAMAVLIAVAQVVRTREYRGFLAPALSWIAIYMALFATSKLILFGWYLVPPLPVYFALAALGVANVTDWAARRLEAKSNVLALAASALLVLAAGSSLPRLHGWLSRVQINEDSLRRPLGEWLRANVPPGEKIMVESIGYVGYFSQHPILDAAGLVSPEILPSYRRDIECPLWDIMKRFRPKWVLLYEREYYWARASAERAGESVRDSYRVEKTWPSLPGSAAGNGFVFLRYINASRNHRT